MQTQITRRLCDCLKGAFFGIMLCVAIDWLCPIDKATGERVVVRTDTTFIDRPVVVYDTISRWETVYIPQKQENKPMADTLSAEKTEIKPIVTDSTLLIPITSRVYTDDSTYRCQVSGYHATLDWMETYHKTIEINHPPEKRSRFHVGLQGGYGIVRLGGQTGFGPYLGAGISFDF